MGIKERVDREKSELRKKIMDAAREAFAADGFEALSMRGLAQRIEYSPTTIYLYFKDKEELLIALCDETFQEMIRTFEALEGKYPDAFEHLQAMNRVYVEFGLAHPHHYRMTFVSPPKEYLAAKQFIGSFGEKAFGYLVRVVQRAQEQGKIRPGDPMLISQGIWSQVHGLTSLVIVHPDFPWAAKDQLIEEINRSQVQGIRA